METLKSYNPATGEILGEVEITPAVEVPNIVARAKAAQPAWGDLGREGRAELIKATADMTDTMRIDLASFFLPLYCGLYFLAMYLISKYRIDRDTHKANLETLKKSTSSS